MAIGGYIGYQYQSIWWLSVVIGRINVDLGGEQCGLERYDARGALSKRALRVLRGQRLLEHRLAVDEHSEHDVDAADGAEDDGRGKGADAA